MILPSRFTQILRLPALPAHHKRNLDFACVERSGIVRLLVALVLLAVCQQLSASPDAIESPRTRWYMPQLFEQNVGQAPDAFRYIYRGSGFTAGFSAPGVTLAVDDKSDPLRIRWLGSVASHDPQGEQLSTSKLHYLSTVSSGQKANVLAFERIRYTKLYPGIDLVYYSSAGRLEYDLVVSPNADPDMAEFVVEGADHLEIDSEGNLLITVGSQQIRHRTPHTYQDVNGIRHVVESRYRLLPENRVRIETGAYSAAHTLTIDPIIEQAFFSAAQGTILHPLSSAPRMAASTSREIVRVRAFLAKTLPAMNWTMDRAPRTLHACPPA